MVDQNENARGKKFFDNALEELAMVGGFSLHVSAELKGERTSRAGRCASMIHAKMCAHARSIGAVSRSSMFDHSAIFSLSRMIVEGMTMFCYLIENVNEQEWEFRWLVLRLHDTTSRIKLMRALQSKDSYKELRQGCDALRKRISENTLFKTFNKDRKERILSGEEMFVGGMRAAASRAAGWNKDRFTAIYNYFSTHSHSASMSFFRVDLHGVDYFEPSDAQYETASFAVIVATACMRRVSLRYLDSSPLAAQRFHQNILKQLRDDDKNCDVFSAAK